MDAYSETLYRIYNLRGGVIDLRLDRMDLALALFGHPEKQFPSFHIAGTNGKGSTAAMIHRILSLAGYRTALYTSPHLVCFTERIRVGDVEISPRKSSSWPKRSGTALQRPPFRSRFSSLSRSWVSSISRARKSMSPWWR